ncbi:MAG: Holliday junction resolvase RuvX [Lachnospiraceae bacterium]|nr:Holliday junction resolvase RuvX [Lachnospiraceae bacterium]
MRIMGLDFGAKTVGVAVSDPLLITAQGVEIIRREKEDKLRKTLARIEELILFYDVKEIVLGMPYNMDDSISERGYKTLEFKEKLMRRSGLKVVLWDERLTTFEAELLMAETGVKKGKQKKYVDMIAAMVILQEYMESLN